jgi:predicted transposase/invertase (TIGR01784 family)
MKGISGIPEGKKRATLYSLIQESIKLDSEEEKQFRELVQDNPMYQEVKMLESVKEVWIEEGMEMGVEKGIGIGVEKGIEKTAKRMLSFGSLTEEQIAQFTGLEMSRIRELAKEMQSEISVH